MFDSGKYLYNFRKKMVQKKKNFAVKNISAYNMYRMNIY